MPGLVDWAALFVALAFMLGAFGQIPINDYMIGKLARSDMRASIYGVRYIVSFAVLAAALPLIAWIHQGWGFDRLSRSWQWRPELSSAVWLCHGACRILSRCRRRREPDRRGTP